MTFGVPYSFVPGTKAKADEVNANFIDVLTKIEDTNLRIDETNSSANTKSAEIATKFDQVEEEITQRANLDLSNLSTTGSAVLSAKANTTDIDGNWIAKNTTLASNVTLSNTAATSYSLSSYLPNDGRTYEVLFSFAYTGDNSVSAQYTINSGFGTTWFLFNYSRNDALTTILPISTARKITITPNTNMTSGTNTFAIKLTAYRKVR